MNCWRTTWGATLSNVGYLLVSFAIGDATGISPIHTTFDKSSLGYFFLVGMILKTVGTQWQGMAAADHREVNIQLGLKQDEQPLYPIISKPTTTEGKTT